MRRILTATLLSVILTLSAGVASADVAGGPGDDVLYGSSGVDRLYGGSGDDTLIGKGGADLLRGGPGWDTCYVSPGDKVQSCEVVV